MAENTVNTMYWDQLADACESRHPSTVHVAQFFDYTHLPQRLARTSAEFAKLALLLVNEFEDGTELTVGLRKLLEAKDAVVRHAVISDF